MSLRTISVLLLALLFTTAAVYASAPIYEQSHIPLARSRTATVDDNSPSREIDEILWIEDFEGDAPDNWYVDQEQAWRTDTWMPYEGDASWRCFDPQYGSAIHGGYKNEWLMFMQTPVLDVSAYSELDLDFQFRYKGEQSGGATEWDGANIWVRYGNSPGDVTLEVVDPVAPAYTADALNSFNIWGWPNTPGWDDFTFQNWTAAQFDLDSYAANYDYVQIVFAFASDHGYSSGSDTTMFGFQIDDINVLADGTDLIWANDADDTMIGGDPIFLSGYEASPMDLPDEWEITDSPGTPYSPTHYAGLNEYAPWYEQQFVCEETFDLPELQPGEDIWLDCAFTNDFYDVADPTGVPSQYLFYWNIEVYDPTTDIWWGASNVGGWSGTSYIYVGSSGGVWSLFSEAGFNAEWPLNELAGVNGVKVRLIFHTPWVDDPPYSFDHHRIDDVQVVKTDLQYDLATMLILPYPTTVGVPNYAEAHYTNMAVQTATDVLPTWQRNGQSLPLYPSGTITVGPDETVVRYLDDPTDDIDGYWIPSDNMIGDNTIGAMHTWVDDQMPENNQVTANVAVMPEGVYEMGVDSRLQTINLSVYQENEGPVVHLVPDSINADIFTDMIYDITELRTHVYFHPDAGGLPVDGSMEFYVYSGGDMPGGEIWSGTFTFDDIAPGYTGQYTVSMDVSSATELQALTGDVWVEARITDLGTGGAYQPYVYRKIAVPEWQQYQFWNFDDANDGTSLVGLDFGHYLTATVVPNTAVETVEAGTLPGEFALSKAYPNPFNPSTTLTFDVAKTGHVSLTVYNVMSQQVATIADRQFMPGSHTATFDAGSLTSGVYFVFMQAPGFSAVQKIMLMK